jgi:8-oxo-dGTP diphosphatase
MAQLNLFNLDQGQSGSGADMLAAEPPERASPDTAKRKRKPYEVAVALVVRDGAILLIRRTIEGMKSSWVLPGGKIDPGEDAQHAAQREVLEETGVACRPVRVLRSRVHPVSGKQIAYVLCEYRDNAMRDDREYDFRWVQASHVPKMLGRTLYEKLKPDIHSLGMARPVRAGYSRPLESCALPFVAQAALEA